MMAAMLGDVEVARSLIARGACVNAKSRVSGHHTISSYCTARTMPLVLHIQAGMTPLMKAASSGNAAVVALLLAAPGVDRLQMEGGRTALDWAVAKGHAATIALLEAGMGMTRML